MAQNAQPRGDQPLTIKKIVENTLGPQRTRNLWSASYSPVLPMVVQEFQMGALLPLMLYMSRFGHRRGRGCFVETFSIKFHRNTLATIADVAEGLRLRTQSNLEGFDDEVGRSVLGDLLLAWCLENSKHAEGHSAGVKRVHLTHYLASWIDLPTNAAHVRGVPDMLTALLAYQETGEWIEPGGQGRFPVNVEFAENPLLRLFARHMAIRGPRSNLVSDTFVDDEAVSIGIDELLAIRMAQACGTAPSKMRGKGETDHRIPNRRPLAWRAAGFLRDDLAIFIETYGHSLPRQTFLQVLESGIGLGLTNLVLSTTRILAEWERTGVVPEVGSQSPWPLFVDASQGQDRSNHSAPLGIALT